MKFLDKLRKEQTPEEKEFKAKEEEIKSKVKEKERELKLREIALKQGNKIAVKEAKLTVRYHKKKGEIERKIVGQIAYNQAAEDAAIEKATKRGMETAKSGMEKFGEFDKKAGVLADMLIGSRGNVPQSPPPQSHSHSSTGKKRKALRAGRQDIDINRSMVDELAKYVTD